MRVSKFLVLLPIFLAASLAFIVALSTLINLGSLMA